MSIQPRVGSIELDPVQRKAKSPTEKAKTINGINEGMGIPNL